MRGGIRELDVKEGEIGKSRQGGEEPVEEIGAVEDADVKYDYEGFAKDSKGSKLADHVGFGWRESRLKTGRGGGSGMVSLIGSMVHDREYPWRAVAEGEGVFAIDDRESFVADLLACFEDSGEELVIRRMQP